MADDLPKATETLATPAVPEVTNVAEQKIDEEHEQTKSVKELMDEGNADLALGKYSSACELFSLAVEKLVEEHGEMSVETVDALEVYGNALLKNAIASSAVLGGPAATANTGSAEPTAKKSKDTAGSSKAGPSTEPPNPQSFAFHFGGDEPDDEDEEDDDEEANGEAEEETDDFENAWEILDSCRAILVKEESTQRKLQLARVHSSMAEVATESGRPEDGVKEYEQALAIQSALLPKWDRLVAQTHLFIALALELVPTNAFDSAEEEAQTAAKSFSAAMEHVEKAKEILRLREAHLKGIDTESDKGKGKEGEAVNGNAAEAKQDLSEKDKEELKDIAELLVELDNKIDDLKSQSEEAATKAKEGGKKLEDQIFQPGPALPEGISREVHNLNSMVKKKKKPASTAPTPSSAAADIPAQASSDVTSAPGAETQANGINGKRKADEEAVKAVNGASEPSEKKVRIEEPVA